MNPEEKVVALLREGNPMPRDVVDIEQPAARYLMRLEAREGKMTSTKEVQEKETKSDDARVGKIAWLAIAVMVVLVAGVVWVFSSNPASVEPAAPVDPSPVVEDAIEEPDPGVEVEQPDREFVAISPETLSGVYRFDFGYGMEITADGHLKQGVLRDGQSLNDGDLWTSGTFEVDGSTLIFISDGNGACPAGTMASSQVALDPDGRLTFSDAVDNNECWTSFSFALMVDERFWGTWRPIS